MIKINCILVVLLVIITSCSEVGKQDKDAFKEPVDSTKLVTVKYAVEGMTCIGCENTVNFAVGEIEGVYEVTSSFNEKYAIVTYDTTKVTSELIEEAVNAKGYTFKGLFDEKHLP